VPELWDELCTVDLSREKAKTFPQIVTHFKAVTAPERKNYPDHLAERLMEMLSKRKESIIDASAFKTPESLFKTIDDATLVIGIDSGPLHLARMTRTPAVGIWMYNRPQIYALPRTNTINVVPVSQGHLQSHIKRAWNIRQSRDAGPNPEDVMAAVVEVLEELQ
jgi:ADP-heptose:LPS heptosyltransferase